jgi:prohibitin 2
MASKKPQDSFTNLITKDVLKKQVRLLPIAFAIGGIVTVAAAYNCLFTVPGGYSAVLFNSIHGTKKETYGEGMHFKWPFFEKPILFDLRATARNIASSTGSSDLQMINVSLRILSRPDPMNLSHIYRTLGEDYAERVLPSIVSDESKAVVAKYTASELLTMRDIVSVKIKDQLIKRAREFNILITEVSMTELGFGKEFRQAVEAKQVAQQDSERAKFTVQRAEQEKQSSIIRARGEAESIELIGKAVSENPNFIKLRKLEAIRAIAHSIAHSKNKVMLNSSSLLMDELGNEAQKQKTDSNTD